MVEQGREHRVEESPAFSGPAEYEYNTLMRLLGVSVSKHLLDEHFTLIWANEFYYDIIGWPKSEYEATFHNWPELYYKEDQAEWNLLTETVLDALSHGKDGYKLLSRIRRKNGDFVWVQFSTQFADEYIDGYQVAYSTITNVDELIQMQKEQSVTYDNMPGFVAKYRFDDSEEGMNLTLLSSNNQFQEYFGSGEERCGSSLYLKNIQDNIEIINAQKPKMRKGEPLHFTMHVKGRNDQSIWLQINATCTGWQEGYPVYLVLFIDITDVTELREMQQKLTLQTEALKDALAVAEKASRAKSDFLSQMSHEIRTPMNAIIGMTTIAAAHIDDKNRVGDCLEKIGYSSKHLMSLINDVLDMSKIEGGKMSIAHETFNLQKVVESIASIIYPQATAKGLTFSVPLTDLSNTMFVGDSLRLNQVLLNLLSNALKFTPKGGVIQLEIRQLRRTDNKARLRFTVSDTGIGMTEEFLERIFMPFEQEAASDGRKYGGTGLGMPITKNLVTLMGGTIAVKSKQEKGSSFVIELDFDLSADESSVQPQKIHELKSLKVLIADDDRDNCLHTSLVLENMQIHSDWVLTGKECVKKAADAHQAGEDYDVCFVDWKMPDIDGIEVTRRMREIVGPDTLIIIITAYDWEAIEKNAREAGVNAFLSKPIFASTLYNALLSVTGVEKAVRYPVSNDNLRLSLAGHHVLLVEDNEINREIALELLAMTDITVDDAKDGKEAVDMFLANGCAYDLILMDVQMPVMDGYEATQTIRHSDHPKASTIPIIAMTADAFHEDVVRAAEAGMNGHLAKPIDPELLYKTLINVLAEQ